MRLGKLSFPIMVTTDQVTEQIRGLLEEKEWDSFEIQKPELVFLPYYVFSYNSFSETADETGVKATTEGEQGLTAMNAQSSELEEEMGQVYDEMEGKLVTKPSETEFKIVRFRIRPPEAEKLSQLKIAAKLGTQKDNIVISGLKQVYFPVWVCSATFENQTMEFEIDAVQGNLLSEEEVPYRGKTVRDLAGETFSDLRNPVNWIKYLVGIIASIIGFFWGLLVSKEEKKGLLHNKIIQLLILIIIVALIVLNETGRLKLWG